MSAEAKIILWWLLFGGSHILGSSVPVRTALIERIGRPAFKGLYSLVAFATLVPLCFVYFANKHAGPQLFEPGPALRWATQGLMLIALVVLVQGYTTPTPLGSQAEMTGEYPDRPGGIQRVTRHPQNMAFALFGVAHSLSNPFVGDLIFFLGFTVFGVLSALHQDRRTMATGAGEVKQFIAETSLIPFSAILSGRQKLVVEELRVAGLIVSIVLFAIVRYFHDSLFGGFGS